MQAIVDQLAIDLGFNPSEIQSIIELFEQGIKLPFITRYRKSLLNSLRMSQLQTIQYRWQEFKQLQKRRQTILQTLQTQQQLTPELQEAIENASNKYFLEDLFAPYNSKKKKKQNKELSSLDLSEQFFQDPLLHDQLRKHCWMHGILQATVIPSKKKAARKYANYSGYEALLHTIPDHQILVLLRGQHENYLQLNLHCDCEEVFLNYLASNHEAKNSISESQTPTDSEKLKILTQVWHDKLRLKIQKELLSYLRSLSEEKIIRLFSKTLQDTLLTAPAKTVKSIMGLAITEQGVIHAIVLNAAGKKVENITLYPFAPYNEKAESIGWFAKLVLQHKVELVAFEQGQYARPLAQFIEKFNQTYPSLRLHKHLLSDLGISNKILVDTIQREYPELSSTWCHALFIAQRIYDPLATLVKFKPSALQVGLNQQDFNQARLTHVFSDTISECVSRVGVDLNNASVHLLKYVPGLNETLAQNIVAYRHDHDLFKQREELKNVPDMDTSAYQQAAGFLKIYNGQNLLDSTSIHPENYPLVAEMLTKSRTSLTELLDNPSAVQRLKQDDYVSAQWNESVVKDVLYALAKPYRDPRRPIKNLPSHKNNIKAFIDLKTGMTLNGRVKQITHFGIFIDVGLLQDGLVPISRLPTQYNQDPWRLVKVNDLVEAKVVHIDMRRRRFEVVIKPIQPFVKNTVPRANSRKTNEQPRPQKSSGDRALSKPTNKPTFSKKPTPIKAPPPPKNEAMANAFSKLKEKLKSE